MSRELRRDRGGGRRRTGAAPAPATHRPASVARERADRWRSARGAGGAGGRALRGARTRDARHPPLSDGSRDRTRRRRVGGVADLRAPRARGGSPPGSAAPRARRRGHRLGARADRLLDDGRDGRASCPRRPDGTRRADPRARHRRRRLRRAERRAGDAAAGGGSSRAPGHRLPRQRRARPGCRSTPGSRCARTRPGRWQMRARSPLRARPGSFQSTVTDRADLETSVEATAAGGNARWP